MTIPSPSVLPLVATDCGCGTSHVTAAVSAAPQANEVHIALHAGGISTVPATGAAFPEDVCQVIDDAGYAVLSSRLIHPSPHLRTD